jgi:hypothetical protein
MNKTKVASELLRLAKSLVAGISQSDMNADEAKIIRSGVFGWGRMSLESLWEVGFTVSSRGTSSPRVDAIALNALGQDEFDRAKEKGIVFVRRMQVGDDIRYYSNNLQTVDEIYDVDARWVKTKKNKEIFDLDKNELEWTGRYWLVPWPTKK